MEDKIGEIAEKRVKFMSRCDELGIDSGMSQLLFLVHMELTEPGNFKKICEAHRMLLDDDGISMDIQETNVAAEAMTYVAIDIYDLLVSKEYPHWDFQGLDMNTGMVH